MGYFTFDLRKVFLVIAVVVVPLMAINMQRNSEEELWFTKPFTFMGGAIQGAYSSFSSGVRGTTSMYLDLINIKTENKALKAEITELRAQLGSMTELKVENERLTNLLGFKQASNMDLLAAKVVGKDMMLDHQTLTVNRGTFHGVAKNMAALTVGGVVGYVFRADMYTSQILLLTDRYAAIDALVQRSRARGIVEGNSRDRTTLKYIKRGDDVQVGDLVVTSGMYNVFPKGFPVGVVQKINKSQYGMTQELELAPSIDPLNLEELFVVLNANQADFTPKPEPVAPNETDEKATASAKKSAEKTAEKPKTADKPSAEGP
ncbi:MAG: rod shape-determining protein MreC [Bdellovibrionales bacterium]